MSKKTHTPMSMADRAKQFMPFSPLSSLGKALEEKEKEVEERMKENKEKVKEEP